VERPEATSSARGAPSRAYRVNLNVLAWWRCSQAGCSCFRRVRSRGARRAQFALLRVLGVRGAAGRCAAARAASVGALARASGFPRYTAAGFVLRHFGAELGGGYFRGLAPR